MRIVLTLLILLFVFIGDAYATQVTERFYALPGDGQVGIGDIEGILDWQFARDYTGPVSYVLQDTLSTNAVRSDRNAGVYRLYRASIPFDTSDLPDNAEITSAKFSVYKDNVLGNTAACISFHDRVDVNSITGDDFYLDRFGDVFDDIKLLTNATYTNFVIEEELFNHIDTAGHTSIGVRTQYDCENIDPGFSQKVIQWQSSETTEIDKRPYLEVTYEVRDSQTPLITQVISPYPSVAETTEWADDIYANGSAADSCGSTIAQCGCALASMSMIGQHYGEDTAVNGEDVNPGEMNEWLQSNSGYTPGGGVLWGKLIEFLGEPDGDKIKSKFSLAGHNVTSATTYDTFLEDEGPAMAYNSTIGHFFVLTEKNADSSYDVRDPFWYNTNNTNQTKDAAGKVQGYGNTINKANLFSYDDTASQLAQIIEVHLGSPAELLISNESGEAVGYVKSTESLTNSMSGATYDQSSTIFTDSSTTNPHIEKVALLLEPEQETHTIQVVGTGEGSYDLTIYYVDEEGYSHVMYLSGYIYPDVTDTYALWFGSEDETVSALQATQQLVRWLPRKYEGPVYERLQEMIDEIQETGVLAINDSLSEALLDNSELTYDDLLLFARNLENDHNRGHGNDVDGCDEDNPGKSKRCSV